MAEEKWDNNRLHVLVIYDIVDDRRRLKLSKFLQGYGFRVQKSAFEAVIERKVYRKLMGKLPDYARAEDSIRVYRILDRKYVASFGREMEHHNEDIIVI